MVTMALIYFVPRNIGSERAERCVAISVQTLVFLFCERVYFDTNPDPNDPIATSSVLATGQDGLTMGGCQAHSLTVHHEPRTSRVHGLTEIMQLCRRCRCPEVIAAVVCLHDCLDCLYIDSSVRRPRRCDPYENAS